MKKYLIWLIVSLPLLLIHCKKDPPEIWSGLDQGYDMAFANCTINGIDVNLVASLITGNNKSIFRLSFGRNFGEGVIYVNGCRAPFLSGKIEQLDKTSRLHTFVQDARLTAWDLDTLAHNFITIDSISADSTYIKGTFQLHYNTCCYDGSKRILLNAPELANTLKITNGTFEGVLRHY